VPRRQDRIKEKARYFVPVIIWLNGGFGAGKTTLAEELRRRLPDAVVYDPEDVGLMLWKWLPPDGDFQHLPSWRELVVATALSLRKHHADTLIVPMSLIRDAYRTEILGALAGAGEEVLPVFLEADASVLRERLNARVTRPGREWEQTARELGMTGVDEMVAAAARQPGGTLMLRSDRLTPAELADQVLAAAGSRPLRGLRRGGIVVMRVLPDPAADQFLVSQRTEPPRRQRLHPARRLASSNPRGQRLADGQRRGEPGTVAPAGHPQAWQLQHGAGHEPAVRAHREQPAPVLGHRGRGCQGRPRGRHLRDHLARHLP
jgi:AAA domain